MSKSPFVLALLAALAACPVVAAEQASTAQGEMASMQKQMIAWRRDFHQHPELSNREVRTSRIVAAQLKKFGYRVRTGIAHTGVVGVLDSGKPGPKLAIRADMDALPVTEEVDLPFASKAKGEYLGKTVGVMHACGHDAHMAMTLGVAKVLAEQRKNWSGQVMFIFQPAEEGAPRGEEGGAPLMVKEGVFKDFKPDAILGMHVVSALPEGTVALRPGGAMASSDTFRIVVHGKQSHGATPWAGIDPIVTAAEIVTAAQTIVSRKLDINKEPAVVTFGIFDGGARFNIVPDTVELQGTVRAFDEGMRKQALDGLRNIAEHVAAAHGATVEAQVPLGADSSNPVNYNDPALTARVRASLETALGKEHVQEARRWTASEDFPHFGAAIEVPSVYFFVGATPQGEDPATAPSNHSPRFHLDEGALAVGGAGMLQVALDYLHATP
ncbi:amidohydrolase [Dokdonella sp.]|uniref:amidohydrolase n=1 Tax=Dokdonella sp. TaxID=2291710 RepID=UPI0025C22FA5|nr:amidohydrolase [Dokdonella sp.]MBX3689294.1 amidohydrolase [Dokdonella sp.]